jgi:dCMP deaminase
MSEWDDFRETIGEPPVAPILTKVGTGQPLHIPSWDEQFMHDVYWWARRSKDPRTKIGAVLVHPGDKIPISMAYNSPARKVNDNVPARWERPEKYNWVVHAENNAVLNCARRGYSSMGTIMYTQGIPCAGCADPIIQGGIIEVVVHKTWMQYEKKFHWDKWIDSSKRSEEKFAEAGIKIRIFEGTLGMYGVLDGKIIDV